MLHNHTSGTPLPNPKDITNLLKCRIIDSGIVGDYGFLNMNNSFKKINFSDNELNKIRIKADEMRNKLQKKAFAHNPNLKYESKKLKEKIKYKYIKENINNIIKEYNLEFKQYGIEFIYIPYKLKRDDFS